MYLRTSHPTLPSYLELHSTLHSPARHYTQVINPARLFCTLIRPYLHTKTRRSNLDSRRDMVPKQRTTPPHQNQNHQYPSLTLSKSQRLFLGLRDVVRSMAGVPIDVLLFFSSSVGEGFGVGGCWLWG